MFIAAQFINNPNLQQVKHPADEWLKKVWHIGIMEYLVTVKNEFVTFRTSCGVRQIRQRLKLSNLTNNYNLRKRTVREDIDENLVWCITPKQRRERDRMKSQWDPDVSP